MRAWIDELSPTESNVVRQALHAAVDGPFFPQWEFSALFGLDREEVREVLVDWPVTADPDRQFRAVNNAMNNLLGYPHRCEDAWAGYLEVDGQELAAILWRIREASGANDGVRQDLRDQLARRAGLPEAELAKQRVLLESLAGSAGRYGVEIPPRLTRLLGAWQH
jgi:hypothetical protein